MAVFKDGLEALASTELHWPSLTEEATIEGCITSILVLQPAFLTQELIIYHQSTAKGLKEYLS